MDADYVEHLDGLEKLMNQRFQTTRKLNECDRNIEKCVSELVFEAELEYGQIPTLPEEMFKDADTVKVMLNYKVPGGSNDFNIEFFFNMSNNRSVTRKRGGEYINVPLGNIKYVKSILDKMMGEDTKISYEKDRVNGETSDRCFHFYGRDWTPITKLVLFKDILKELFSVMDFKSDITEIDISNTQVKYVSELQTVKEGLTVNLKDLQIRYDGLNQNGFAQDEVSSLSSYSKRFMELDNVITDIVKNQGEPYVFDMVSTIPTTSYMKGRLQSMGVYTARLREFAQEDGHENSIFRRMELLSKEMGNLFKETHAGYFAERAKFYKKLALNKQ